MCGGLEVGKLCKKVVHAAWAMGTLHPVFLLVVVGGSNLELLPQGFPHQSLADGLWQEDLRTIKRVCTASVT